MTIAAIAIPAVGLIVERASNLHVGRPRRDRRPRRRRVLALLRRPVRLRRPRLPVRDRPRPRDLPALGRAQARDAPGAAPGRRLRLPRHAGRGWPRVRAGRRDPGRRRRQRDRARGARRLARDARRRPPRATRPTSTTRSPSRSRGGAPAAAAGRGLRLALGRAGRGSRRARAAALPPRWAGGRRRGAVSKFTAARRRAARLHGRARRAPGRGPAPRPGGDRGDGRHLGDADRARPGRVHDPAGTGRSAPARRSSWGRSPATRRSASPAGWRRAGGSSAAS